MNVTKTVKMIFTNIVVVVVVVVVVAMVGVSQADQSAS